MKIDDRAKKLRIAFVLDRYNPRGRGEGYFSWLIEELSKRGAGKVENPEDIDQGNEASRKGARDLTEEVKRILK